MHVVWIRNHIGFLGVVDSIDRFIRMYCDNSTDLTFSKNLKGLQGARYINVNYFNVKEKVPKGLNTVKRGSIDQGITSWLI